MDKIPDDQLTYTGLWDSDKGYEKFQNGRNVVLMGDAAHPTTPFLGMGCNMALSDACFLGKLVVRCKIEGQDIALKLFEKYRLKNTNEVVRESLKTGYFMHSTNWFVWLFFQEITSFLPLQFMINEALKWDVIMMSLD
eukprot:UN16744